MRRRNIILTTTSLLLIVLIFDAKAVCHSALEGIKLCIYTIVPSLFPFFVISGILNANLAGIRFPRFRKLRRILNISDGAESIFLLGILGGYPVGAKCIGECRNEGIISKKQAEHLLSFCNNCGPSFIFGICANLFSQKGIGWLLWGIQILTAALTGIFQQSDSNDAIELTKVSVSIPQAIRNSIRTIAEVSGWVILFKIIIQILERWILWLLPEAAKTAVYGFLELTNGCMYLQNIQSEQLRFILCAVMLSFGGCCVMLQTSSVIYDCSILAYIKGKTTQTVFAISISTFLSFLIFDHTNIIFIVLAVTILILLFFAFLVQRIRKKL